MNTISFENRVVIVTGAAGALGRSYALDIARRGGAVVVNDLGGAVEGGGGTPQMADAVVAEIRAAGGRAVASYDSVSSAAGAARIAQSALDQFGRVDALINNAGNFRVGVIEDSSEEDLLALLSVHLVGSYLLSKAVWPHMRRRGYGRIVFTASSAGVFGHAKHACYGAAKAGIVGLMNAISHEGKPHGILCNALMPNGLSRMTARSSDGQDTAHMERARAMLAQLRNSMDPSFNTGLATYLASERCQATHGIYSSCGGRIGRVFIGVSKGWQGSREEPSSAEDIAERFEQIDDWQHGFDVPTSPTDELRLVLSAAASTSHAE